MSQHRTQIRYGFLKMNDVLYKYYFAFSFLLVQVENIPDTDPNQLYGE